MSDNAVAQMESFSKRLEGLTSRRTRIQVQLETARQQYEETRKEALAAHGTANLNELRQKLVALEEENTKVVAEFGRAVDEFEKFITRIENALANPQLLAALAAEMETTEPAQAPAPVAVATQNAPLFDEEDI